MGVQRDDIDAWTGLALMDYDINTLGSFLKVVSGRLDAVAGVQSAIDSNHHEIHEGDHYKVRDFVTLGSGGTITFVVDTPAAGDDMHMFWKATSPQPMEMVFYEAGSYSTGGTTVTPRNSNRDYADNSSATIQYDPTIVSLGTRLGAAAWGKVDVPSRVIGGEARGEDEDKLGTNQTYMYHFLSKGADNTFSYDGNYYHHNPSIT